MTDHLPPGLVVPVTRVFAVQRAKREEQACLFVPAESSDSAWTVAESEDSSTTTVLRGARIIAS